LENLAEFYIFIWGTVPGGDEDIWAIKLYSGRMQNPNDKNFSESNNESRLFYFLSNDHFSEKAFGHMNFRSNDHFLFKKAFGQRFFGEKIFR
jgi:hypothetical protein